MALGIRFLGLNDLGVGKLNARQDAFVDRFFKLVACCVF